uniref:Uncharacterized protein n=1 Tax=Pristhesancus plagipennis TaxID=1955184 RepID=A0A2K8JVA2_PRIPG|nr:secreted hypothetical protein [Pristhesancus plagipennis]
MRMWIPIIFLLIFQLTKVHGCDDVFAKCFCGEMIYGGNKRYVLNCTDTGFKDSSVLQKLPDKIEVLIFTGNNIPELPLNVFGTSSNNSLLKIIDMSNNKIKGIRGKTYHRVSSVERLILNHNEISISKETNHHHPRLFSNFESLEELHLTDAFADNTPEDLAAGLHDIFMNSDLDKLRKLHLEQNEITSFKDPRVFCDLKSLLDLHLGDNKQKHITFHLDCLANLRFIDLEKNSINYLSFQDLEALDKLSDRGQNLTVDFTGNPFVCGNKIEEFYSWLQTTKVVVRNKNKLRCKNYNCTQEPYSLVLDHYKNGCSNAHKMKSQLNSAPDTSRTVLFLSCALILSLCALIYTNREPINSKFLSIARSLSRKIHYTNIGKQEAQEMDV